MTKIRPLLLTSLMSATLISTSALTGCQTTPAPLPSSSATATKNNDDIITVNASGKVVSVPDMAEITFSIHSEDKDVTTVQNKNSTESQRVIEKLKELGVSDKSIKTSDYDITPQYDYDADVGDRIVGYRVVTTLTVSDVKIEDAGHLISGCVEAGINSVENIRYFCSTYDEDYQAALKEAVQEATRKAGALAEASNRSLGKVKVINEGYQNDSLQYRAYDTMSLKSMTNDAVVMPGESEVEANITATFELK